MRDVVAVAVFVLVTVALIIIERVTRPTTIRPPRRERQWRE